MSGKTKAETVAEDPALIAAFEARVAHMIEDARARL